MAISQQQDLEQLYNEQASETSFGSLLTTNEAPSSALETLIAGLSEGTEASDRKVRSAIRFQTNAIEDYQRYLQRGDLRELVELLGTVIDGLGKMAEIRYILGMQEIQEKQKGQDFLRMLAVRGDPNFSQIAEAMNAYLAAKARHAENARTVVDFFKEWATRIHQRIEEVRLSSPPDPWPPGDSND